MLLSVLEALDGAASTNELQSHGIGAREVRAAVECGDLVRLRQGWVALPTAARAVAGAVRVGGTLSCVSMLRRQMLWCVNDRRIHVRVPPNLSHLASPFDRRRPLGPRHPVTVHRPSWAPPPRRALDDFGTALACATVCQPRLDAIVTLDDALAQGFVSPISLADVLAPLPAKYRAYLALVDPASQSGLETKARLQLRSPPLALGTRELQRGSAPGW